jgi:hypothetical protein
MGLCCRDVLFALQVMEASQLNCHSQGNHLAQFMKLTGLSSASISCPSGDPHGGQALQMRDPSSVQPPVAVLLDVS